MKRQLGPWGSLVAAVLTLVIGTAVTVSTLVAQQALAARGTHGVAEVVAANHGAGRLSEDSLDVVLVGSTDRTAVRLTRFDSRVQVGDRIDVLFDGEDPSTIVQEGYKPWGPFEILMLFLALAGLVFSVRGAIAVTRQSRRGGGPRSHVPAATPTTAPRSRPAAERNPGLTRRRHRRR